MTSRTTPPPAPRSQAGVLLKRGLGYLLLWIVLIGWAPGPLAFGIATAAVAAWVSLRLMPVGALRIRLGATMALVPHFLWQSVVAGVDVARRALDPRLPLAPGFVVYRPQVEPGLARNVFTAYSSLLPGTVSCGEEGDGVVYHCLDLGQPVIEQLSGEEARLARAIEPGTGAGTDA